MESFLEGSHLNNIHYCIYCYDLGTLASLSHPAPHSVSGYKDWLIIPYDY
jgi:hypothetical protein